jgi:hypothetical protein
MHRIKLLGGMLGILFVLALVGTATAAAAEISILPEATEANPISFKISSGKDTFAIAGGTFSIKCGTDEGTGTFTSRRHGRFDVLLLSCTTAGGLVKCTGLNDTVSGSILFTGSFLLRRGPGGSGVRMRIEPNETHIECSTTLILFRGCIVATVTPTGIRTSVITVTLKQKEGKDEETTILNEAETGTEECALKAKEGEGAEKSGGQEDTWSFSNFEQGGIAIEVEVMA